MIYAFDEYNSLEEQISIVRDLAYKKRPGNLYDCVYVFMYLTKELWHPVIQDMLCDVREDIKKAVQAGKSHEICIQNNKISLIVGGVIPWYEYNSIEKVDINYNILLNHYENITRPPYRREEEKRSIYPPEDFIVNERHLLQALIEILYMKEESLNL